MVPDLDGVPPFDKTLALQLLEQDSELLSEVVEIFREHTAGLIEQLDEEIQEANADEVARLSHSIKGGAASVCAERIRVIANALEEQGNEGMTDDFPQLYEALQEEFQRFEAESELIA